MRLPLRPMLLVGVCLIGGGVYFALREPFRGAWVEYWHGGSQRIGHLGLAQPDFNVQGVAEGHTLIGTVNGGEPAELTIARGAGGFRRLGGEGHFNFEIPISDFRPGPNEIQLEALGTSATATARLTVEYVPDGGTPSPFEVLWASLDHPQDAGQVVDGEWELTDRGLRSRVPAYDRLFLLGDMSWRDYEVRTQVTIHGVAKDTGAHSGAPGVGFIMRFAGHVVDPPRFPEAQPKWGFQPFGAMLWLRFIDRGAPVRQFYRGDRNESEDHAALAGFVPGETYELKATCETDPEDPDRTRYTLTVWESGASEPGQPDFTVLQESAEARKDGGVALVVHHADATFGDLVMRKLPAPPR